MQADRFRLRRSLEQLERTSSSSPQFSRSVKQFLGALEASVATRQRRLESRPKVTLNAELPIAMRREEIAAAIKQHQVVILCGETGSGKSTQLPLICLDLGRGVEGLIGHTQPRRIAARSVATRIASELSSKVGEAVGFKVRFTDATSPQTYIKLMTDGILLAESQNDRFFDQYDTLIIDEAHERSLNIDFLLGRLKQLLPKRPDLKVIITSATIDAARFADHFGTPDRPAPVIEVAGRTYPVEVRYRPLIEDVDDDDDSDDVGEKSTEKPKRPDRPARRSEPDIQRSILNAVDELTQHDPTGDILLFMPTERDILETAKSLRGRLLPERNNGRTTEILPLYARLSDKDQQRIFEQHPHRRIVIATNVAESSLTVPGIRYVIDSGTARISRYSARSRMQRLPVEAISQASANQRAGRCGRIGPGVCIRLYAEDDFKTREPFTPPEIQRTDLASVILQTKALKLGKIEEFPFLEPPKTGTINDGYRTLFELGALDDRNELTPIGEKLSRLPVDPRVGRIILAAHDENCLTEVLIIASALELQDPRDRPVEHQQAADQAHEQFKHEESDFLSYLKLWDFYHHLSQTLTRSKLRKACQQNFLSYNRLREWVDIHQQLSQLVQEAGIKPHKRRDDSGSIHRALLTGFIGGIATLAENGEYIAAGNQRLLLWPGSGLMGKKPKWIVAAELVETLRRYLRVAARINPEWIEPLAGHLIKRTYSDPTWDPQNGSVMAFEKVTLFGLPIVQRRRVNYSRIDPTLCRKMMIEQGLVAGNWELDLGFFQHNKELIAELETLQVRTRRSDLLVDDEVRIAFYEQRIPLDVSDGMRLRKWLKSIDRKQPKILHMTRDDLRREGARDVTNAEFPDRIAAGHLSLPLEYHLEPGKTEDGITLSVPKEALNQLTQARLGWLVPGLLEEKLSALIKSLPKETRRMFVPANETAKAVLAKLKFGEGDFEAEVARLLSEHGRVAVRPSDFDLERLPSHLRMNVKVVDDKGEPLAAGRNLLELHKQLGGVAAASFKKAGSQQWSRDKLTEWNFGELPAQINFSSGGVQLIGYPSLIDQGDSVSMRLIDTPTKAAIETRSGLRRLAALALRKPVKYQLDNLPDLNQWTLWGAALGCTGSFQQDLADLIVDRAFFPERGAYPRTEADFKVRLQSARANLGESAQAIIDILRPFFLSYAEVRATLNATQSPLMAYAVADVKAQLAALSGPQFLTRTPSGWLAQYARYMDAIVRRLKKLTSNGIPRDRVSHEIVQRCLARYQSRASEHAARALFDPELDLYRWMLEELRVSLFAQELRTAMPISETRLEKQWEKVRA